MHLKLINSLKYSFQIISLDRTLVDVRIPLEGNLKTRCGN